MWIYKANYIRSLCVVKSSGLDSQIHRVMHRDVTGKIMLWDLGQTFKMYIDKWLKTGSK